jgi:hypothetical protein
LGRNFVVTNSNTYELGKRKKAISKGLIIGPAAIKFITLTIIAVLAVVYLSQSTAGAARSVKIRDLDDKKTDLTLQKERLEAEQTRLKALKEIDSSVDKPVLEPVSSVNHIQEKNQVAKLN